jgi:hypothetical protein
VKGAPLNSKGLEQGFDQGCYGRLPKGAEAKGGDRDPELADREVGVELPRCLLDQTC